MRRFAILFCGLKLMAQQDVAVGVAIDGTVVETGTGIPVAGAKVVLRYSTSPAPLDTDVTAAAGTFHFSVKQPGKYAIEASAPGFRELIYGEAEAGIQIDEAAFQPGAINTAHMIALQLTSSGVLTGRVCDAETGKPIPLLTTRALRLWWSRGKRKLTEERIAFTDDDGVFRLEVLPSGEYLVEIENHRPDSAAKRYPILVRPGADPDDLQALNVSAGSELDLGTIDYARTDLPRISGTIASCPEGNIYQIAIHQRVGGALIPRDDVVGLCGAPFTIPSLAPGSYRFMFRAPFVMAAGNALALRKYLQIGMEDIQVEEGPDLDLQLKLVDAPRVSGRIVCDCEMPPAVAGMLIRMVIPEYNGLASPLEVPDDGVVADVVAFPGLVRVNIGSVPNGFYVTSSEFLTAVPGSTTTLEVVLSDRTATVTGTVLNDRKPAPGDHVVIARRPLQFVDGYADFKSAAADADGAFTIQGLAPGAYRMVAVGPSDWARTDMPNVVEGWLAPVDEITLTAKETRIVSLNEK